MYKGFSDGPSLQVGRKGEREQGRKAEREKGSKGERDKREKLRKGQQEKMDTGKKGEGEGGSPHLEAFAPTMLICQQMRPAGAPPRLAYIILIPQTG